MCHEPAANAETFKHMKVFVSADCSKLDYLIKRGAETCGFGVEEDVSGQMAPLALVFEQYSLKVSDSRLHCKRAYLKFLRQACNKFLRFII